MWQFSLAHPTFPQSCPPSGLVLEVGVMIMAGLLQECQTRGQGVLTLALITFPALHLCSIASTYQKATGKQTDVPKLYADRLMYWDVTD